ncbi:MAG: hypothetical protein HGA49_06755 [Eubacteriaceae bacterium]|nr:hypothetical protein [Eubacteriaceae bacterium]
MDTQQPNVDQYADILSFMPEDEKLRVFTTAQGLTLKDSKSQLHKKIIAYRKIVTEWNEKDRKEELAQRSPSNYMSHANKPPFLAGVISTEGLQRVYQILDTLYHAIEKLGGKVNADLSLQIRNENVAFQVVEAQDKIDHILTKQEAKQLIDYQDEKRRYSWARAPKFRKHDYVFNGRLRFILRKRISVKDTDKYKIEDLLGDILIELYEKSEDVRNDRLAREEAERKRLEKERLREEREERYNIEVVSTLKLENAALDYEKATRLRVYIKAIESSLVETGTDDETSKWIEWAKNKADWYDPTIARDDEYFGKRKHEENADQKVLKRIGYYWRY